MPLHLLGKKSWNVYNRDNIARVRRDELEAKAREEREDRERQQDEAERRLRILRGQSPISPRKNLEQSEQNTPTRRHEEPFDSQSRTKRRKLANENDTDRDIRLAKHDVELRRNTHRGNLIFRNDNTPLFDEAGHISLFSAESKSASKRDEKNTETEIELLRKQCEYEDQHTMHFSKAAGYRQSMENPWYSSSKSLVSCSEMPTKDIWGNEDIRRREREKDRISTSDPLTIMKRGVRQLREVEKAREYSNNPRSRKNLDRLDRPYSDSKCHRKRSKESINSLDDFSLDVCRNSDGDDRRHHSRHSHHSRHRRHHRHHGHSREKGSRVL